MIQAFTARVLDGLDRIYQIVGPVSRVDSLDVSPPLLVHDVSREAELSSGFFSNVSCVLTTAGAAADTFASTTRAAALAQSVNASLLAQRGLTAVDVDIWIYGATAIITAATEANFGHARQGVRIGTPIGGGIILQQVGWTAVEAKPMVSGGVHFLNTSSGAPSFAGPPFGPIKYPIFMADDTDSAFLMEGADDAGGAMTVTGFWVVWIGPKGAPPPAA